MSTTYDIEEIVESARIARRWVAITGGLTAAALVVLPLTGGELLGPALPFFIAGALAGLVAGFKWINWFRPVYAQADRHGGARFSALWAWLGWLFPGASLVLPKMMVNDVWRTVPASTDSRVHGGNGSIPQAVQVWWVLWVAPYVVSRVFSSFGFWLYELGLVACTAYALRTIAILTERAVSLAQTPVTAEQPVPVL